MKLSSKYFDEIRSKKTEKEHIRNCESLGCTESGEYIAKSKKGKVNYGWQKAFQKNFGMTPKTFYKEFHTFMKKPVSKQMAILMAPAKL